MNKRLKELEKQSVFYHEDEEYWDFDRQKFAELIVRECLGIIDEEGSHEGGSIRSMEAIKEHFGVEEK